MLANRKLEWISSLISVVIALFTAVDGLLPALVRFFPLLSFFGDHKLGSLIASVLAALAGGFLYAELSDLTHVFKRSLDKLEADRKSREESDGGA